MFDTIPIECIFRGMTQQTAATGSGTAPGVEIRKYPVRRVKTLADVYEEKQQLHETKENNEGSGEENSLYRAEGNSER